MEIMNSSIDLKFDKPYAYRRATLMNSYGETCEITRSNKKYSIKIEEGITI